MPIKMNVPDDNAKKKIVSASGGHHTSSNKNGNNGGRYAESNSAVVPITKNSQFAGSGANVTMTQPMFFSPLHTPQNWQIASKRREIYQWARFYYENEPKVAAGIDFYCFEPKTPVLMADGGQKTIESIEVGDLVRSHDGSSNEVTHVHCRNTNEEMLKIKIAGISQGPLKVTTGHNMFVMRNGKIVEVQAGELSEGDWLVSPCNYEENQKSEINFDKDFSWLLGLYAAEGCGIPYQHTSLKGKMEKHYKGVYFYLSADEYDTLAVKAVDCIKKYYGNIKVTVRLLEDTNTTVISAYGRNIADDLCGLCPGIAKDGSKRFSPVVLKSSTKVLTEIIKGFMEGDGCFNKNNGFQGVGVSKKLSEQIANICDILGLIYSFTKTRISKGNRQTCYNVRVSRRSCGVFADTFKHYKSDIDERYCNNIPYKKEGNYILRKIISIKKYRYSGEVYDLTVKNAHTYIVNRVCCHNSQFPMNGFVLEQSDKKVLKYFEKISKDLRLNYWLKLISHEYFMIGDVFPFTEIHCPACSGAGMDTDGNVCNHPNGKIKRIVVLNPDWIEVQKNVLANEPVVVLVPDEELRSIVSKREPKQIYDRLPSKLIQLVSAGQPIPLSNRSVSHLKYNDSPYGTYGVSLIRRLFTVLAYKTKIMTANWIVAERLILPIRVVKIGDKERPASPQDILDVSNQLSAVANDPNLTLVTHHAFEYDWYGATGKIHNITAELEHIGKEILDGMMLNQSLLNGEMTSYSSAQVGVETMIRRLDSWRNTLAEWVENHIFLPIAMMQGFVDEKESKEIGEIVYKVPKLVFNDMNLRDKSNHLQLMSQLHDKGLISTQKLLEEFDIDYDQETERIRDEQVQAGPQGQMGGMGGMGGGAMGGMGGAPMGGGAPPDMGGMPGAEMGGMPGAEMGGGMPGGDMGGGMPGAEMGGAAESIPPNFKVGRKGKGSKTMEEQLKPPAPKFIKLTKLEQKMYKIIQSMQTPYQLYGQYSVNVAGQQNPYVLDFAYPNLGIGIEADGKSWHENVESKIRDKKRDQKLADIGWRILRFKEDAIHDKEEEIRKVINSHIQNAVQDRKNRKKKSESDGLVKEASIFDNLTEENLFYNEIELNNGLGYIYLIGKA